MEEFDFVVVGAGSAGCVLASRLTENGRFTVKLLEAGPRDNYHWLHIPIGYAKTMFNKKYNWGFQSEPEPHLNGRNIYQPRGRVLGGSPQLLQVSGVGNSAHLMPLGIPMVAHLPGVGENLQDHFQARLMFEVSKPITTNDDLRSLTGQIGMGLKWLFNRSGPLAVGINMAGMFCKVLPESTSPDIQFHFGTLSADLAAGKPHDFPGCTYSVCQLRPESRGHLRITSKDSRDAPKMLFNYLATEHDQRTMVEAVKFARKVARAKPIAHLMKREYRPGHDVNTDDEILAFCKQFGTTIFHPSCTARMGQKEDSMAVVDERLRVHGTQGLRVAERRRSERRRGRSQGCQKMPHEWLRLLIHTASLDFRPPPEAMQ